MKKNWTRNLVSWLVRLVQPRDRSWGSWPLSWSVTALVCWVNACWARSLRRRVAVDAWTGRWQWHTNGSCSVLLGELINPCKVKDNFNKILFSYSCWKILRFWIYKSHIIRAVLTKKWCSSVYNMPCHIDKTHSIISGWNRETNLMNQIMQWLDNVVLQ